MKDLFIKLILKRIINAFLIIFILVTVVFFLIRMAPGDQSQKFISPKFNKELSEQIKKSYGLEKPLLEQYILFIKNIISGDLGYSYEYHQKILVVIKNHLPFSVLFSILAVTLQLLFAIQLSKICIYNRKKKLDKLITGIMTTLFSVPTFVLGLILVYLFSVKLNIFPSSGLTSIHNNSNNILILIYEYCKHLTLPLITIIIPGSAIFFRYIRDNMESQYDSHFIVSLRANGVDEKTIIKKHLLPHSLFPLIGNVGIELGILFAGSLITEVIFSLPGMGRLIVQSILMRDYPLVVGSILSVGILIIIVNFIVDIISIYFDKRMLRVTA